MEDNQFSNKNPFSVPDGYFENFQHRIMSHIREEEKPDKKTFVLQWNKYGKLITAAACILFVFIAGTVFYLHSSQPSLMVESADDEEDMYQWMDALDRTALMIEVLGMDVSEENMWPVTACCTDEQEEEIIDFLERDNISVAAIVHSIDNDYFY